MQNRTIAEDCDLSVEAVLAKARGRKRFCVEPNAAHGHGAQHARHCDSLARIAAMDGFSDVAFLTGLLREASYALRDDVTFSAVLVRRGGGEWIVEASYRPQGMEFGLPDVGARMPLNEATADKVLRRGTTLLSRAARGEDGCRPEWRSLIAAPVTYGTSLHLIVLASPGTPLCAFDDRDRAYVDALATLCGARLQERERNARLRFREEQDAQLRYELARALSADEFVLHFQPEFHLPSGRMVGAEALIRWNHPERGQLQPAAFIPFAEEHGLMPAIGRWVMRESVAAAARFRTIDPLFRVWFNLSAVELCDARLLQAIAEYGPLDAVGVEITESAVMHDLEGTLRALAALKAAGAAVALDDFGTGQSSLVQLKRLPLDVVKLDRAFTAGIPGDAHDGYIVDAVLTIARQFGFGVVAEGIESAEQARWLRARRCGFGQGYFLARPVSAARIVEMIGECAPPATRREPRRMLAV